MKASLFRKKDTETENQAVGIGRPLTLQRETVELSV